MNKIDNIDKIELKKFGLIMAVFISAVFGLLLPFIFGWSTGYYPWVLAAVFLVLSLVNSFLLLPIYRVWMVFGGVMGWINTRIILMLVYVLMFIPIGILMKFVRYDPMKRKIDSIQNLTSYRTKIEDHAEKSSLENPF